MANAFNLTAQINLRGPTNLKPVISQIRKELGTIGGNINLSIDPKSIKTVSSITSRLQSMNAVLVQSQKNVSNLNSAFTALSGSVGSVSNSSAKVSNGMTSIAKNTQSVAKSAQQATDALEDFGKKSFLAVKRFAAFSIVTTGIYALTNAITGGLKAFINFDKELVKLQQVTGQGAITIGSLEKEITRLATTLGVSSESLLTVASTLAQAGLSADQTRIALAALAKTELAPSFDNLTDTTEGAIAALRQFGLQAQDLEAVLGSINAVAAAFAVESKDIIAAIQRTGGVFAAASKGVSEGKDALNEFIAVFTSVRATTRESAETIATGLRTIFTRIQRAKTIDLLKEYGVVLTDLEGKFVGPYEAVKRLSAALNQIDPRDIRFATIVEELGGFRQIGKVIPLIQQFATAQDALRVAQRGQNSLTDAQVKAQQSLANQLAKVREQFLALVREIGKSGTFQALFKVITSLASGLISLAGAFKPILPILAVLGAVKGVGAIGKFATGFFGGLKQAGGAAGVGQGVASTITGAKQKETAAATTKAAEAITKNTSAINSLTTAVQSLTSRIDNLGKGKAGLNSGGKVLAFARGGVVPGQGNRDTVPAMLQPGEFVIRKKAVQTLGADRLHKMNKYAAGGVVIDKIKKIDNIIDGDTFDATVTPKTKQFQKRFRISDYDAWETISRRNPKGYSTIPLSKLKKIEKYNKEGIDTKEASKKSEIKIAGNTYVEKGKTALDLANAATNELSGIINKTDLNKLSSKIQSGKEDFLGRSLIGQISIPERLTTGRKFNLGGKVQKFQIGGTVQDLAGSKQLSIEDAALQMLSELGGIASVKGLLGARASDRTLDGLLRKGSIQSGKNINQVLEFLNKASEKAGNIDAGLIKVGLAGLGPIDYSKDFDYQLGGRNVKVVARGFASKYLDAVMQLKSESANLKTNFAQNLQYADIFEAGKSLAFDFDDTLVEGADILGPDGKPDIAKYSDRDAVKSSLRGGRLTPLGEKLKTLAQADPRIITRARILTARPQSTADLLGDTLRSLGLPFNNSQITGVATGANSNIGQLKAANLAETERLIDDTLSNIEAARGAGRSAILYQKPKARSAAFNELMGQGNIEGAAIEGALAEMIPGLNLDNAQRNRAIDFVGGLGEAARFFPGINGSWPAEIKRTIDRYSLEQARDEITRAFSENLFAKGGAAGSDTVPALLTPGEFVINKRAAQNIGYSKLNQLNKADKIKGYNKGGIVGFKDGGKAPRIVSDLEIPGLNTKVPTLWNEFANALMGGIEITYEYTKNQKEVSAALGVISANVPTLDRALRKWQDSIDKATLGNKDISLTAEEMEAPVNAAILAYYHIAAQMEKRGAKEEEIIKYLESFVPSVEAAAKQMDSVATSGKDLEEAWIKLYKNSVSFGPINPTASPPTPAGPTPTPVVPPPVPPKEPPEATGRPGDLLSPERKAKIRAAAAAPFQEKYKAAPSSSDKRDVRNIATSKAEEALTLAFAKEIQISKKQQGEINDLIKNIKSKYEESYNSASTAAEKEQIIAQMLTEQSKAVRGYLEEGVAAGTIGRRGGGGGGGGGGPGVPNAGAQLAAENKAYFAAKAEKEGMSVESYRKDLASKVAGRSLEIQKTSAVAKGELKVLATGQRENLTGQTISDDLSKNSQEVQDIIGQFAAKLREVDPTLSAKAAEAAAISLAKGLTDADASVAGIIERGGQLQKSMEQTIDEAEALAISFSETAESAGLSEEALKQNVSDKQIAQQRFIQSDTGKKFGKLAEFAPGLTERFSKTGIGQRLGAGADFIEGKGGKASKLFSKVGGFAGIGGGIATAADFLKNALPEEMTQNPNVAGAFGGVSGAATGMASGAQLGSMVAGPVGAMIGALGGAIAGGIEGYLNAKNLAELQNALDAVTESSGKLDEALQNLQKDASESNFKKAQEAFGEALTAQSDLNDIAFNDISAADTAGYTGGGALAGAGIGAAVGSVVPVIGTAIGAAVGAAAGGIGGYMASSSAAANQKEALGARIRASETNQRAVGALTARQLSTTTTEDLGKILDEANKGSLKLSPTIKTYADSAIAAANKTKVLTDADKERIRTDAASTAAIDAYMAKRKQQGATDEKIAEEINKNRQAAINAGNEAIVEADKQAAKQEALARAMKQVNTATDNLLDAYKRINAGLQRFTDEVDASISSIQGAVGDLTGNAEVQKVSRENEKVLGNISAYSMEEVKSAAQASSGMMGGGEQAGGLVAAATTAKVFQDQLPALLRQTEGRNAEDVMNILEKQITGAAGGDSVAIQEFLKQTRENLNKQVSSEQGTTFEELAGSDLAQKLSDTVQEGLKVAVNVQKTYNDTLDKTIDLQNQYNKTVAQASEYQRKATSIRLNAEIDLAKALGRDLSLEQLNKPFTTEIRQQTAPLVGGGGTTDPTAIFEAIRARTEENTALEQQRVAAQNQFGMLGAQGEGENNAQAAAETTTTIQGLNDAMGRNKFAIDEGRKALEKLANDGSAAANALSKIQEQQQKVEGFGNMVQKLATSTPQELFQFGKQGAALDLALSGKAGNQFKNLSFRQDAFAGLEQMKEILSPEQYKEKRGALIEQSLRSQGFKEGMVVPGMGGMKFEDIIENLKRGPSEDDPNVKAYKEATARQAEAAELLGQLTNDAAVILNDEIAKTFDKLRTDFPNIVKDAFASVRADAEELAATEKDTGTKKEKSKEQTEAEASKQKEIAAIDAKIKEEQKNLASANKGIKANEGFFGSAPAYNQAKKMKKSSEARLRQLEKDKTAAETELADMQAQPAAAEPAVAAEPAKSKEDQAIATAAQALIAPKPFSTTGRATEARAHMSNVAAGQPTLASTTTASNKAIEQQATQQPAAVTSPPQPQWTAEDEATFQRYSRMGKGGRAKKTGAQEAFTQLQEQRIALNPALKEAADKRRMAELAKKPFENRTEAEKKEYQAYIDSRGQKPPEKLPGTVIANATPNAPAGTQQTGMVQQNQQGAAAATPITPETLKSFSDALTTVFSGFGSYVEQLAGIKLPTKIEMVGTHTVDVRVTGAAAFEGLQDGIKKLVNNEISKKMEVLWNQSSGQLGEPPAKNTSANGA